MHNSLALLYLSVVITFGISPLYAQSQAESTQQEPTLEQKYQEELNNAILRAYEGDRDAQFRVGVLFTNDQFAEPDFEQAVYWYKQAARQDHALAQYNLGHQYLNGIGVLQSTETAMQWWLKAARLGHPLSQFNVGRAYYLGIGLPGDLKKSKYWFEQAAANQEPKSIEILAELKWDTLESSTAENATDLAQTTPNNNEQASTSSPVQTEPQVTPANVVIDTPADASFKTASTDANTRTDITTKVTEDIAPTTAPSTDEPAITLYTAPSGRSILISMVYDPSDLVIVKHVGMWTRVRHKKGFPVWVHKDFVSVNGSKATITGNVVNTRAVPLIIEGSIVGKLNKGDKVDVINETEKWYRVTSPSDFSAWVKTEELNKNQKTISNAPSSPTQNTTQQTLKLNSNVWLFKQDPNNLTLQLASFDTIEGANKFISNSGLANDANLYKFTSTANNITWTYFLYGSYSNDTQAKEVQQSINTKDSWVRNIGKVQQNRCIAWKKQLPTPRELNMYCTPASN